MPDWKAIIGERLILKDLSPRQQDETIAELAGHLDDVSGQYRAPGKKRVRKPWPTLSAKVSDWQALSQTIKRAKREEGSYEYPKRTSLMPGFVTLRERRSPVVCRLHTVEPFVHLPWAFRRRDI